MSNSTQYTRTDKAIQSALMQLVSRKPFEKITVQDILDETPVSRATFYKHYHDKYEIVEKLQAEFLQIQREVILPLSRKSSQEILTITKQQSAYYRQVMRCLLKVHTENVDLTKGLMNELQTYYLRNCDSPTREIEARIFGGTLSSFQIACLDEDTSQMDFGQVMCNVMFRCLGLENDTAALEFMQERLRR